MKPASKLSGIKGTKVREPSVVTNFQGLIKISPMMVERNNTTLKDQVKKTTEWRVTSTNRLNVKTVKRKPKKIIPVILEWKKMMLYVQEKKKKTAAWKQLMQSSEQNKTERHSKEVSSYMRYRKRSTDSNSFR